MLTRAVLLLAVLLLGVSPFDGAHAQTAPAQTIWRLLDYIAVDYREAVRDGKVVNDAEYVEMVEFSKSASERITQLPVTGARQDLQQKAVALEKLIAGKQPPETIAVAARAMAADLIKAYPVPLAPSATPDLSRGEQIYAEQCAACHGANGDGKGPDSVGLDPPPIEFTDAARASERSVFALFQVIEQGLYGTSMRSFAELSPEDRWAVAFYSGTLAFTNTAEGERIWKDDAQLRASFNMDRLVGATPAALAAQLGDDKARAITAYLRRHPEAVAAEQTSGALTFARGKLNEALTAYEQKDSRAATDLALSAYLDGFEPVEAVLAARDQALMLRIETAMIAVRAGIANGAPVETVRGQVAALDGLFAEAEKVLGSSEASSMASFLAAFTILVREGLEALLIVIAMIAFLNKADSRDVLPYVHGGWAAALVAGAVTWVVATWMITISGASRELTEGFGSLLAAAVLLWVGIWMHGKSHANAWQRYIREKMGAALNKRSAWFLFALAFVVVYREVFETILFYAAIWAQGNGAAMLAGAGAAIVVLTIVAVAMITFSRRLPIGQFFRYSSWLIAGLAVVLIGKGTSALQEAGYIAINPLAGFPRSQLLGIYPTQEGVIAQLLMAALLIIGFVWNNRQAAKSA